MPSGRKGNPDGYRDALLLERMMEKEALSTCVSWKIATFACMKKLAVGDPIFKRIREEDALYVDKTRFIHDLISAGGRFYFLSRPRRFGKSLLVSTLMELFKGKKELFKDLWIYDKHDFEPRPVILISFTDIDFKQQSLETAVANQLDEIAANYGISLSESTAKEKFSELIRSLGKEKRVAVLVDEYDKPIIDYFDNLSHAMINRDWLRNFFGTLKALDVVDFLQFVFITGVSKFSKVSLFSELNHLTDLTLDFRFANMLGITPQELEDNFEPYLQEMQIKEGLSREALLEKIRHWYNGYSWDGKNLVSNPFSILSLFSGRRFRNFWFATGTPSWLVHAFKSLAQPLDTLEEKTVVEGFFDKYDIEHIDLYSLMFQTGYLTVRRVEEEPDETWFTLGFPNNEVRNAFNWNLLEAYSDKYASNIQDLLYQTRQALLNGDPEAFVQELKAIFADISYQMLPKNKSDKAALAAQWEGYFQSMTLLIVKVLGISISAEVSKSHGRIDAVMETPKFIYLLEFKLEDSAEAAMKQIKEKQYAEAYRTKRKGVFLVAIAFSAESRNVSGYLVEKMA